MKKKKTGEGIYTYNDFGNSSTNFQNLMYLVLINYFNCLVLIYNHVKFFFNFLLLVEKEHREKTLHNSYIHITKYVTYRLLLPYTLHSCNETSGKVKVSNQLESSTRTCTKNKKNKKNKKTKEKLLV